MAQPVVADLFRPPMALRQTARGSYGNPSSSSQFGIGDANDIGITLLHRSPAWAALGRVGWGRGEAPPPCRGTPLAIQSECRAAPSHPQAEAPGDQLGRV